ncbi:unnamed protein product [Cladocopium goreaui]|uniref:Uncharacterized protein n=1 Tax=Cladocopium goreaui TaxID=2562237 RepID=A0A9P1FJI5_9DINO|nr:unnamed protein product [Cladocopium goreaui]
MPGEPVPGSVTGSDVTCLDVKVPRAPAVPKVPKPEDCSPEAKRWPKASNLPKGPTIMLPPGAIKPHSEYQDERLKKRTAYLPRCFPMLALKSHCFPALQIAGELAAEPSQSSLRTASTFCSLGMASFLWIAAQWAGNPPHVHSSIPRYPRYPFSSRKVLNAMPARDKLVGQGASGHCREQFFWYCNDATHQRRPFDEFPSQLSSQYKV